MFKSVKIRESLFNEIGKRYGSSGTGLQRLAWMAIKASQVEEQVVKDLFTEKEWVGMADAFNGTIIDPEQPFFRKEVLVGQMEDSERYESTSTRHGYGYDLLMDKINSLSEFQALVVMELIHRFWNENEEKKFEFLTK